MNLFFNRLIKFSANGTKPFSYFFHYLFPKKRFTIAEKAAPLLRHRRMMKIPEIIWQTNYTDKVTLPVYLNYLFNRLMAPTYEHRFMGTQGRLDFIKANFPEDVLASYKKLNIGASQADMWRLLVLKHYGGVYMDIDAHLVWPLHLIIKPEYEELFMTTRAGHYTNYFLASRKDSPHIDRVIGILLENIRNARHGSVYDMTGPPLVNEALQGKKVPKRSYRVTCVQGSFTNEYFQYIDSPQRKWTHARPEDLLNSG